MKPRRVVVLGATGSIGDSALKVARDIPERMEIVGLAANRNAEKLASAANETRAPAVCLVDEKNIDALQRALEYKPRIFAGDAGLREIACLSDADMVLVAIVGTGGLRPALAAIEAGKDLAVASKEILVMAGEIVMRKARDNSLQVLPVDSEHNAIFQCLEGKGLEMIEAHWLFDVEMKRVEVVIHPQSIVHSMVEFTDGSTLAQLSYSNMCFPIQYAVTWPDRVPNTLPPLDFSKLSKLEFFTPRYEDFPALNLARRAGETGGTLPAVMNAANEIAVAAFLDRRLRFPDIWHVVEEVMNRHTAIAHPNLDAILEADRWARREAHGYVKSLNR